MCKIIESEKQPENWIHYSSSSAMILMANKTNQMEDSFPMKPRGLWITPEYANHNWFDWCTSEDFYCGNLNFIHDVKFKPDAKLLRLENADELDEFTKKYVYFGRYSRGRNDCIRWEQVADAYQGILIPNYIWERRLMAGTEWYYPWDCASGCVWDATAVECITVRPMVSAELV